MNTVSIFALLLKQGKDRRKKNCKDFTANRSIFIKEYAIYSSDIAINCIICQYKEKLSNDPLPRL